MTSTEPRAALRPPSRPTASLLSQRGRPGLMRRNHAGRSWCGPAALTVLTGLDYAVCREAIASVSGAERVIAVSVGDMGRALRLLRPDREFRTFPVPRLRGFMLPTLVQFLRQIRKVRDSAVYYLVLLTGHYVVIRGRKLWDNQTAPEGVLLSRAKYGRRRVVACWELIPRGSL